ncbi:hypothetical protein [Ornithinimicrobium pekingense]|uniref:Uncharacterized protein n=1 Tax=Ornithinimicrobium pekingense TaxID=384677 RepID=A0ABQ2FBV6_9MICO|nr:hypothetical protein [Ornithinimicrobium pekingense]GGK79131.1 hypothetical protein GCM10011509_29600 [Ornithinimicrobium pekingense]
MSEPRTDSARGRGHPRESFRLTLRFGPGGVELVAQEHLPMITPPSVGEPPEAGRNSGTWLELLDPEGRRVGTRVLHDPFRTRVEHHSPDGRIEHYESGVSEGLVDVLVPAVPGATSVALVSSELPGVRTDGGAVEVARFELARRTS